MLAYPRDAKTMKKIPSCVVGITSPSLTLEKLSFSRVRDRGQYTVDIDLHTEADPSPQWATQSPVTPGSLWF